MPVVRGRNGKEDTRRRHRNAPQGPARRPTASANPESRRQRQSNQGLERQSEEEEASGAIRPIGI